MFATVATQAPRNSRGMSGIEGGVVSSTAPVTSGFDTACAVDSAGIATSSTASAAARITRSAGIELLQQFPRRDEPIRILQNRRRLLPVRVPVEIDPDPAARPHVRRTEEPVRVLVNHLRLIRARRLAPHARPAAAMMVSVGRIHREHLVLHAKGRLAPRLDLMSLRERQADLPEPSQRSGTAPYRSSFRACGHGAPRE